MSLRRPSKNMKCPCGSGKKYRKCCKSGQPSAWARAAVEQLLKEHDEKRREFIARHGHVRAPVGTTVGDKAFTALEGKIYVQTQEGPYNFVNALHDHALHFIGIPLLEKEEAKPISERLEPLQWLYKYIEQDRLWRDSGKADPSDGQTGAGAAWIRFAYDLYTIRDNSRIETRLRQRLFSGREFQGARYELWVAALCIAAGFDLDYEDDTDNSRGHPEFVATDRFSPVQIIVEAKSRHRHGVKGHPAGKHQDSGESVGIRDLVLGAYKKGKEGLVPLYVFIDLNLPPFETDEVRNRWILELQQTMSDLATEGYVDPCPANAVFFSNDPSHYLLDKPIGAPADRLWITHFTPDNPKVPHPPDNLVNRFLNAHHQRAQPPEHFFD